MSCAVNASTIEQEHLAIKAATAIKASLPLFEDDWLKIAVAVAGNPKAGLPELPFEGLLTCPLRQLPLAFVASFRSNGYGTLLGLKLQLLASSQDLTSDTKYLFFIDS